MPYHYMVFMTASVFVPLIFSSDPVREVSHTHERQTNPETQRNKRVTITGSQSATVRESSKETDGIMTRMK